MAKKDNPIETDFVNLARVALSGRSQDVSLLLQRAAKKYSASLPELSEAVTSLLVEAPTRASPLRKQADSPMPVDIDSRLHLMRVEATPELDHELVLSPDVEHALKAIVSERRNIQALSKVGLSPARTSLFVGPPGVGKTMSAYWLARELGKPLLILDLSAVMSSYLGRTGANLRHVLEYAKSLDCVLLLDELDAIAKRRDDRSEVGELKRLVTVLIQQLDDWPPSGILIAATNHPDLLDPAIWRRFDIKINFPLPDPLTLRAFIKASLGKYTPDADKWSDILAAALYGVSFSDAERALNAARRAAAISGGRLEDHLLTLINPAEISKSEKISLAKQLVNNHILSQRAAHELLGVSRDTIRGNNRKNTKTSDIKEPTS